MNSSTSFSNQVDFLFKEYTGWFSDIIFFKIPFTDSIQIPWVVILLVAGALFFTIQFSFVQFRLFPLSFAVIMGKYRKEVPNEEDFVETTQQVEEQEKHSKGNGEISHFQALTAALSATVGLGNIAGVAIAISIGGPGATFWMILAGLLGMASKFAECTLGLKYRTIDKDGKVYGGPMYYLSKGFSNKGAFMKNLGKFLAVVFAIMIVGGSFGGGNMFQANQAAAQMISLLDLNNDFAGMFFGIAIIIGIVIIGGIKRIATVTEKIVPFMAALYVGTALVIIVLNYPLVPVAIDLIFDGAFSNAGIAGGIFGVIIQGFKRAAFSNEAGVGSAAIIHAAVKTRYAASEGIVALLEPFIDTVVICTITALVLIITNIDGNFLTYGQEISKGVEMTSIAFESVIPNASILLTVAVVLFAFSTMISWSYYGMQGWKYLFGKGKLTDLVYKLLFLVFVVIGSSISLGAVIDFSDAMIFAMVVPNMIGLVVLSPVVKLELGKYLRYIKICKSS